MTPPRSTTKEEDHFCILHEDYSDLLHTINASIIRVCADMVWFKRIAYVVASFIVGFSVSIWGVFYPYITQVTTNLQTAQTSIAINSNRLAVIERMLLDYEKEHREIRSHLDQQRSNSNPFPP